MEHIKQRYILVTGAHGQLGWELSKILNPDEAVFVDRDELDITNAEAVNKYLSKTKFTHIVNCAAYTAVDKAESDEEVCRKVNAEGVKNIVEAIKGYKTRLIHISTDFVFDGKKDEPYTEEDEVNALSVYGRTKAEGEEFILRDRSDAIIIRTGWLYSAHGNNFVKTMLRLASGGKRLKVINDQQGTPTWAADLASAIKTIIYSDEWRQGIYHFSNMGQTSWYGLAEEIFKNKYPEAHLEPCTTEEYATAAKRPAYSVLDKSKIVKIYNIQIPIWQDSLKNCLANIDLSHLNH